MTGTHRLIRWALGAGAVALLLTVGVASAAAPTGPRLAVIKLTWKPQRLRLLTIDPHSREPVRLVGGEGYALVAGLTPLSWRPDGEEVAFSGIGSIILAEADGSGASELNTGLAESPVFAPDGRSIAFTRHDRRRATIWTVDLASGVQRQLTPWRSGLEYFASSFSPDGTTLLATRIDSHRSGHSEPVALHLDTGGVTRLFKDGIEPVYSPDGSKIALLRLVGDQPDNVDLFVLDAASGALRRLTRTPHKDEFFASWDPSGERIAFARFRRLHFEWANSVVQINADGTCEAEVLPQTKRTVYYAPAWQPGPGREAGRIRC